MQLLKPSNYFGPNLDTDDIAAPPITHQFDLEFKAMPVAYKAEQESDVQYPTVTRISALVASATYNVTFQYPFP